jgi:hypothetical protein
MGKVLLTMALPFIVAWAVSSWWKIRRARSQRERTLLSRASLGATIGAALAIGAIVMLPFRGQAIAIPIAVIGGIIYTKSIRAARERILDEEKSDDPVARAKRVS